MRTGRVVMACMVLGLGAARGVAGARSGPPAELLASLSAGPAKARDDLRAFLIAADVAEPTDDLLPGALLPMLGVRSLDGVDLASEVHVLVADLDGTRSSVLLARVSDAKQLANGLATGEVMLGAGWAAIGPRPLLDRIGRYALDTVAAQRPPAALTITVYLQQVLARSGPRLRDLGGGVMTAVAQSWGPRGAQLVGGGLDWLGSLAADVDQLVVALDATPETGSLDITLRPRSQSKLMQFVLAQRPTDYALLERLPATTAPLVLAGTLDSGPYRASYHALMWVFYGMSINRSGLDAAERLSKASSGTFAIAMQLEPGASVRTTGLFGLSEPQSAGRALARIIDFLAQDRTFDAAGMSVTIKRHPGSATHDRVALRGFDTTVSFPKQLPSVRGQLEELVPVRFGTELATFDAIEMRVMATDSLAEARRAIDAARGKAHFTAAPLLARSLGASRARKDSAAIIFDPAVALAEDTGRTSPSRPMLITFGFADRNAHVRVELQPATLRTLVRGEP